jgi:hypothetical protein
VVDRETPAPSVWATPPSELAPGERGRSAWPRFLRMFWNRFTLQSRIGNRWWVRAVLKESRGRLVPVYLEIWPQRNEWPPDGITPADIRAISFSDAAAVAVRRGRAQWLGGATLTKRARRRLREHTAPQPGRRLPDDDVAEYALEYVNAFRTDPRRPIQVLVEQYVRRGWKVSDSVIRDRVRIARRRGFLTSPGQGSAGGEPTEKLLRWQRAQKRRAKRRGKER